MFVAHNDRDISTHKAPTSVSFQERTFHSPRHTEETDIIYRGSCITEQKNYDPFSYTGPNRERSAENARIQNVKIIHNN